MAGKCKDGKLQIPQHKHIELLDWGGLWKVNTDVVAIFSVAKSYLSSSSTEAANITDIKFIFSALMASPCVLIHFSTIRDNSPDTIQKEIALNLLEDLLILYLRVRIFSHVKGEVQACRIQKIEAKSRSLHVNKNAFGRVALSWIFPRFLFPFLSLSSSSSNDKNPLLFICLFYLLV